MLLLTSKGAGLVFGLTDEFPSDTLYELVPFAKKVKQAYFALSQYIAKKTTWAISSYALKENVFWLQSAALKEPAKLFLNIQIMSQREARIADQ